MPLKTPLASSRSLSTPLATPGGMAASRWLAGGISASDVVAAYEFKGAASLAGAKVNLANPGTYNLIEGISTPAWDSTNGLGKLTSFDQILDARIPVESGWSVFCVFSDSVANANKALFGQYTGGTTNMVIAHNLPLGCYFYNPSELIVAPQALSGSLAMAGNTAYRNGIAEVGSLGAFVGTGPAHFGVGGYWNGSSMIGTNDGYIKYLYLYSSILTALQISALHSATI